MDELDYDIHDIFKTFISMSYAVGTLNQAFFVEDDLYLKAFKASDLNQQVEFHNLFINDESTMLIDNIEGLDNFGVDNFSLDDVQYYVREKISRLTGTSYLDDEDDDEDEDEDDDSLEDEDDLDDDDDESEDDETEEEEDESDYSDLLSADMESVNTSDDLIVSVIRKK